MTNSVIAASATIRRRRPSMLPWSEERSRPETTARGSPGHDRFDTVSSYYVAVRRMVPTPIPSAVPVRANRSHIVAMLGPLFSVAFQLVAITHVSAIDVEHAT